MIWSRGELFTTSTGTEIRHGTEQENCHNISHGFLTPRRRMWEFLQTLRGAPVFFSQTEQPGGREMGGNMRTF